MGDRLFRVEDWHVGTSVVTLGSTARSAVDPLAEYHAVTRAVLVWGQIPLWSTTTSDAGLEGECEVFRF